MWAVHGLPAVVPTVCITTVNLDLLSENRNFGDLYWLEIPKGANVPIKWTEMLFISRVPSVVIISVVTCVVIVSLSLYAWSDDRKKGSPKEQEGGHGEDWWDSERLERYRLIDRRGRRKGQKPLKGGTFSQKELLRGTFYTQMRTRTHTQAFSSWWCGIWLPLGGSSHMRTNKFSALR